jgi:hypothetical protein
LVRRLNIGQEVRGMKAALAMVVFLFASGTGYSQLYFGPVAGPMVSRVSLFEKLDREGFKSFPSMGFYAGGMVSMKVHETFFLSGTLIYSQKGKWVKGKEGNEEYNSKSQQRYIELPIFYTLEFRHRSPTAGGFVRQYNWFIGGGPIISYWLGGKGYLQSGYLYENFVDKLEYNVTFGLANEDLHEEYDYNTMNVEDPNRWQLGLNVTGGVALQPVGLQRIVIAGHLEIGQTFLSRNSPGYFPATFVDADILKARWTSVRLSASYLFDTKISEAKKGKSTKDKEVKRKKKRR